MFKSNDLVKRIFFVLIVLLFFVVGFFINQKQPKEKLYQQTKLYLGSFVEVQFYCDNDDLARKAFLEVFNEIERIDRKYSFYSDESYLSQLNSVKKSEFEVDEETFYLLNLCDSVYRLTEKKFDVSIGQLTNFWKKYFESKDLMDLGDNVHKNDGNFKIQNVNQQNLTPKEFSHIVSSEIVRQLVLSSGWDKVKLLEGNEIYKPKNILINLDAIVQGYAADRAITVLNSLGISKALVNAGGEIKVSGTNWIIGIKHPRLEYKLIEKLNLCDWSVATSGDYEKFVEVNGKRYHHILDPSTGYPSTKNISVTVIAKNCDYADALATGFFSLEPEIALKISETLSDVFVYIVSADNKIYKSKNFEQFLWRN